MLEGQPGSITPQPLEEGASRGEHVTPLLPAHASESSSPPVGTAVSVGGSAPAAVIVHPEVAEAFGKGAPWPVPYEAFGRGEEDGEKDKKDDKKKSGGSSKKGSGKKSDKKDEEDEGEEDDDSSEEEESDEEDDEGENDEEEDSEDEDDEKSDQKKKGKGSDKKGKDGKGGGKGGDKKDEGKDGKPKKKPAYKRPGVIIAFILILAILIVGVILIWMYERHYVRTDDAYIDGHVTQIAPQVAAPVLIMHIDDNVFVHKGDVMVELDPTDYKVALEQAKANVEATHGRYIQAQSDIPSARAKVGEAIAAVDAAQVQFENAQRDRRRYETVDVRARSQQQLDNAVTAEKNAAAQLEQAKARKTSADADVVTAEASTKAAKGEWDKAIADEHKAEVNLGYCTIVAPSDGRVTSRTIEPGTYVNVARSMFSLVSPDVWVTANFKENQLTDMKVGQKVRITVDAFPGHAFDGHVDSIQAGSGSRFSVLPAENATGNFVKIVQRVPVKILFEHNGNTDDSRLLSPGLSVEPRVTVLDD